MLDLDPPNYTQNDKFTPHNLLLNQINFKIASLSDVEQISDLVTSTFGANPKSIDIFSRWIEEFQYHVTSAVYDDKIIAVGASCFNEKPDLAKYEAFGEIAVEFLKDQKVGWFLTLAVLPQYRKNQIGWIMAKDHSDWLKSQGITRIVGTSWVTGSADNSTHLFIKAGFEKLGESNEFLRSQLHDMGSQCSACGKIECECLSVLYGLKI